MSLRHLREEILDTHEDPNRGPGRSLLLQPPPLSARNSPSAAPVGPVTSPVA
jgi:hypothetical protein